MEIKKSEMSAQGIKFIAEENGQTIGWALLYMIQNDRHDEPYGLLENVFVEPEFRSKGIGRQLLETAIAEAKSRGCYKLLGTSRHSNTAAHKFYEKFGFQNWGVEFRMNLKESEPKQEEY